MIDADEGEVAYAVANVTLYGLLGTILCPYLVPYLFSCDQAVGGGVNWVCVAWRVVGVGVFRAVLRMGVLGWGARCGAMGRLRVAAPPRCARRSRCILKQFAYNFEQLHLVDSFYGYT